MTEIPEHLLKRSKAAKADKTGAGPSPDTSSESTAPAAAAPAPAAAPANLPNLDPEPVPATPEPHFVAASKRRVRIPVWALPVVAAVPIWAYSFAGTMQQVEVEDPLFTEAAALYGSSCAGCHGAGGGGGTGYALADGEVLATFPDPIDQMAHVARGSAAIDGETYGAQDRRTAGDLGVMPAHLEMTQIELEMVVFHERAVLSGEDTSAPSYLEWMDHMREGYESGDETAVDLDLLLACSDPDITPGASGDGPADPEAPCPGPSSGAEQAAEG